MPITKAMWTHGHAVRLEHPDRFTSVWRAGFYVRLTGRAGQGTWIHYAVPTPVIVRDDRLRAVQCMLRCRIPDGDASIAAVHIYDGERRLAAHSGLGAAPRRWAFLRYPLASRPEVHWGIGISIQLRFDRGEVGGDGRRVEISSAGCDFVS